MCQASDRLERRPDRAAGRPRTSGMLGLCVALDDEDHRVAGDGAEADGPHVAELLVEAFTALTLVIWWAWSARV